MIRRGKRQELTTTEEATDIHVSIKDARDREVKSL